jgi:dihydropyrimidinase
MDFDTVIRGGHVVTADQSFVGDVGIKDGVIAALDGRLSTAAREIDARGKLVLPGGVDSHCHVEQLSGMGLMCADDFYSATVSAAFGGTTTIIPFAAQHRGQSLREVVKAYHGCAEPKAVVDYAFHLIISDPSDQVMGQELPALIRDWWRRVMSGHPFMRRRMRAWPKARRPTGRSRWPSWSMHRC